MRNENDSVPIRLHLTKYVEQVSYFVRCQYRRGFIENQHFRLAIERFDDLNTLLFTDGELPHVSAWIDFQSVTFAQIPNTIDDWRQMHQPTPARKTEGHVLSDS